MEQSVPITDSVVVGSVPAIVQVQEEGGEGLAALLEEDRRPGSPTLHRNIGSMTRETIRGLSQALEGGAVNEEEDIDIEGGIRESRGGANEAVGKRGGGDTQVSG